MEMFRLAIWQSLGITPFVSVITLDRVPRWLSNSGAVALVGCKPTV